MAALDVDEWLLPIVKHEREPGEGSGQVRSGQVQFLVRHQQGTARMCDANGGTRVDRFS